MRVSREEQQRVILAALRNDNGLTIRELMKVTGMKRQLLLVNIYILEAKAVVTYTRGVQREHSGEVKVV